VTWHARRLKRPPGGVPSDGPAGRFLLHKALFVHCDEPGDERLHSQAILAACAALARSGAAVPLAHRQRAGRLNVRGGGSLGRKAARVCNAPADPAAQVVVLAVRDRF
jgi:hypothetical protein